MTINAFAMKKLEDFTVMQANEIVGHVRVKPNAVLWKPKNGKMFFSLPLEEFGAYCVANGKKQKK